MYHHAHALSRSLSPLAPFEHMQATGGGAAQYLKALPAGGWGKSLGGVGLWWGSGGEWWGSRTRQSHVASQETSIGHSV